MPQDPSPPQEKKEARKAALRAELSWPQLIGSVSAAVAASAAASYLGVIGTIAGAAIFSLVITIGSALFRHSLEETDEVVRNVVAKKRTLTSRAEYRAEYGEHSSEASVSKEEVEEGAAVSTTVDALDVPTLTSHTPWWKRKKLHLALTGVAVFLLAMGVVTGVELATGKPLSEFFGADSDGGTSISRIASGFESVGGSAKDPENTPQQQSDSPIPQQPGEEENNGGEVLSTGPSPTPDGEEPTAPEDEESTPSPSTSPTPEESENVTPSPSASGPAPTSPQQQLTE